MGGRLWVFLPADYLEQVCHGGGQAVVFPYLCGAASDFVEDPCLDVATQVPAQARGSVRRSYVPPQKGGHGDWLVVAGLESRVIPIIAWLPSTLVDSAPSSSSTHAVLKFCL